jgi:mannose-6-phosphate isomerase-like protein (cupin superfamily)
MEVQKLVVKPGEGRSVWLGGMGVVFKISGAKTRGAFAVVEHPIDPGRLVLPHVHVHEDEYSYVLEGTIGARVGDHEVVAGQGSYAIKPRGLMHSFWNAGPGPVQTPGGHRPRGLREVLRRTRRGRRPGAEAGAGGEVRGDLLIGLGRRADEVQPEVTRPIN